MTELKSAHLPYIFYLHHLKTINGVKFTPREIGVISCIISGRSSKKIAVFLNMAPRTVDSHVRHITQRLDLASREQLIDFIEHSEKYPEIKKYYSLLSVNKTFENILTEISKGHKKYLYFQCLNVEEKDQWLLKKITESLDIAGVKIHFTKEKKEVYENSNCNILDPNAVTLCVISDIKKLQNVEQVDISASPRQFFLFFGTLKNPEISEKKLDIIYFDEADYYSSFFQLLKKILPDMEIDFFSLKFVKEKEESQSPFSINKISVNTQTEKPDPRRFSFLYKFYFFSKKVAPISITAIGTLAISYLLFTWHKKDNLGGLEKIQETFTAYSNFTLPTDSILLHRPELLALLKERFKGQEDIQTVALIGLGGTGKTTIARLYSLQEKFTVIGEINAETKESIREGFENLAQTFVNSQEDKEELQRLKELKNTEKREHEFIKFVKRKLESHPNWFLIYDNVEDFSIIKKHFPCDQKHWGKGKIIITTRNTHIQSYSHITHTIQIGELDDNQKLTLFTKIMTDDRRGGITFCKEETKIFLSRIPPFPLDISLAAYYIKTTNISYSSYLERLTNSDLEFSAIQRNMLKDVGDYLKTRYHIIHLIVKELLDLHKDFGDLLVLLSLIDSQHIPKELLDHYKTPPAVDNLIYNLKKYSLITNEPAHSPSSVSTYSIHRSVQETMLLCLTRLLQLGKNHPIITIIARSLEKYSAALVDKEDLLKMRILQSHYVQLLSHKDLLTDSLQDFIKGELGYVYYNLGHYIEARQILEKLSEQLAVRKPEDKPRTAQILFYLANTYWDLGEFKKSKSCLEDSLSLYKKYTPENKLSIARALGYLGIIYNELEDYGKAIEILQESLLVYKQYCPEHCAGIAQTVVHLGIAYRSLGDYKKARVSLEEALVLYQEKMPGNHISFAWALTNLGNVSRDLGKYEKAHELYKRSLAIYQEYLPEQLVEIGRIFARLGNVNRDLGNLEKAKEFFEKSLSLYKLRIPEDHVAFAWALAHLGNVYRDLGDYLKAKECLEKSLLIYKKNLPEHCIELSRAKTYLGAVYKELGYYEEAKELFHPILLLYQNFYGEKHIETARLLHTLGQLYLSEEHLETAGKYLYKALDVLKANDHTDSYKVLEDLAQLFLKKSKTYGDTENTKTLQELEVQANTLLTEALHIAKAGLSENSPHITRLKLKIENLRVYS